VEWINGLKVERQDGSEGGGKLKGEVKGMKETKGREKKKGKDFSKIQRVPPLRGSVK